MAARVVALALIGLIVAMQYGLWLGRGSWLRVWEIDRQIAEQRRTNERLSARNAALDAEVRDLKEGLGAIEERARNELGMVRHDEIFFQVLEPKRSGNNWGPSSALAAERQTATP
ncbi:MAG: cell division protein FtsB [Betaproteobacteria bacterium]|nr:MAG: cell division protein FtsB [Betaproteobacteria bacterium]